MSEQADSGERQRLEQGQVLGIKQSEQQQGQGQGQPNLEENPPREEFTDITIQRDGKWFNRDKLIHNTKVLSYFKANLHCDDKGIYILNSYGRFSEKGYCKVYGPVMNVVSLTPKEFIFENGTIVNRSLAIIILDKELIPYIKMSMLHAWAMFSRPAYFHFADQLVEQDESFYFDNKKLPVEENIIWYES